MSLTIERFALHNATQNCCTAQRKWHIGGYVGAVATSNEERDAYFATIFDEIQEIARRGTARSRRIIAPLSFVEHSLITYIGGNPGSTAADIAASFQLNRSTTSRQVGGLIELGLVEHADDGAPSRGHALALTTRGRELLESSRDIQRGIMASRLGDWSEADVRAFAAALTRYNASASREEG